MKFLLTLFMVINVHVVGDTATPALQTLQVNASRERVAAAVTAPCYDLFQKHFYALGRNKHGWPSTGYWESASVKTFSVAEDGVCYVGTTQIGARQRFHGGKIEPVNAQYLTIPISPVAYGHTAGDFPGSFLLVTKNGAYLVQPGEEISESGHSFRRGKSAGGNAIARKKASLNFLFKLVRSVNQEGDENVLPTNDEIFEAVERGIKPLLDV